MGGGGKNYLTQEKNIKNNLGPLKLSLAQKETMMKKVWEDGPFSSGRKGKREEAGTGGGLWSY